MKKRLPGLISLLGLIISFLILRFPLLNIHGMKEWPFLTFVFGAIFITIFGIILSHNIIAIFVVIGYVLGFIMGYIFKFDYGIGLNSLWIIWMCSYLVTIIIGIIVTIIMKYRKRRY